MHNSILEYASTASILKPFEKKFLKKCPQILSKPPSPQETGHEKEEGKSKALRVSSNKRGSQYFERGKHFNFKNPF
jgi:hypothetical protein